MNSDYERCVDRWLAHIRALAEEIGPRGPTTREERRASEYCQEALVRLGLEPRIESFTGARSIFHQPLLGSIVMLVAFVIYPLAGRVSAGLAVLLSLLAVASVAMELTFRDNPLRWLVPKAPSQNVVATIPPAGEHQQDLVLVGHVDTQAPPSSSRRHAGSPPIRSPPPSPSAYGLSRSCSTSWGLSPSGPGSGLLPS